jgi:protein phosphatase
MTTIFFTNTGPDRELNEDAILAGPVYGGLSMGEPMIATHPGPLVALADGMGGGPGGAAAARVVLEDLAMMADSDAQEAHDAILECLYGSVARMGRLAADEPALVGMGSTVAGVWRRGQAATIFNCGDCRVYRRRDRDLELLSRDHSPVYDLYLAGEIGFEDIRTHQMRHLISSAVQQGNHWLDVFSRVVRLRPGDLFLICSDGLWESLAGDDLAGYLASHSPEDGALALSRAVMEENAGDNFSFALLEVDGDPEGLAE